MPQLTLRVPESLAEQLKRTARERGRSVNGWATEILGAAVDPSNAGDRVTELRERLMRAGVLAQLNSDEPPQRPEQAQLEQARAAAGRGTPLSQLVSEGRGH